MPEKPVPNEQTEVPTNNNEPEEREADECVPTSSGRKVCLFADPDGVPGVHSQREIFPPHPMARAEGEEQQQGFDEGGIPEAHCRTNEFFESRSVFYCNDFPLKKLLN